MRNEVTEKLKAAQSKAEIATLLNEKIGDNECRQSVQERKNISIS
jgi:hypothetical protein